MVIIESKITAKSFTLERMYWHMPDEWTPKLHSSGSSLIILEFSFCPLECMWLNKSLWHTSHHLLMLSGLHGVFSVMDHCDVLWDGQVMSDYVYHYRTVDIFLRKNCKWVLSFPCECELFLIPFPWKQYGKVCHMHCTCGLINLL